MITRLRRWARRRRTYGRHLKGLVNAHMDTGYNLSQATYQTYEQKARLHANLADPGPGDETRFDLIRRDPRLPRNRW